MVIITGNVCAPSTPHDLDELSAVNGTKHEEVDIHINPAVPMKESEVLKDLIMNHKLHSSDSNAPLSDSPGCAIHHRTVTASPDCGFWTQAAWGSTLAPTHIS